MSLACLALALALALVQGLETCKGGPYLCWGGWEPTATTSFPSWEIIVGEWRGAQQVVEEPTGMTCKEDGLGLQGPCL